MNCVDVNETVHMVRLHYRNTFVCVTSHMEWVPYLFCVNAMCHSNMYLYRSQLHCVSNDLNRKKKLSNNGVAKGNKSHRVNDPLVTR